MHCEGFRQHLPDMLAQTLDTDLGRDAELHIAECEHCLQVFASYLAGTRNYAVPDAQALTALILQATDTAPCQSCEAMLCDYIDAELESESARFMAVHLEGCDACRQLCDALMNAEAMLDQLVQQQPPADLVPNILRQTSLAPPVVTRLSRLTAFGTTLLQRPRFPLEASFVTTLVWIASFGLPASIDTTAFAEQLVLPERLPLQQIVTQAQSNLRELRVPMTDIEDTFDSFNHYGSSLLERSVEKAQNSGGALWQWLTREVDTVVRPLADPETE